MKQIRVAVCSSDALTVTGVISRLDQTDLAVVQAAEDADVVVTVADRFLGDQVECLRQTAKELGKPMVLITDAIKDIGVVVAVECQVVAILSRAVAAEGDHLANSVRSAAEDGANLPPDLLAELIEHTERLHRTVVEAQGLNSAGLVEREIDVLRLMAEGLDTAEIATQLNYSERTVKNIIYAITDRLNLRNRPQAVAYAVRAGVI